MWADEYTDELVKSYERIAKKRSLLMNLDRLKIMIGPTSHLSLSPLDNLLLSHIRELRL
jgi:hypothetical protein